ncbi:MAG: SAM-dependent methyltransferase, partial [Desulfohalobiaceae bacterium]
TAARPRARWPRRSMRSCSIITVDCSFISLQHILPPCLHFIKENGQIIALIKPQFEVGRGRTDKGVVRSKALQQEAVARVVGFAVHDLGLRCLGVVPSKVKGPKGNQEFLALFQADQARNQRDGLDQASEVSGSGPPVLPSGAASI